MNSTAPPGPDTPGSSRPPIDTPSDRAEPAAGPSPAGPPPAGPPPFGPPPGGPQPFGPPPGGPQHADGANAFFDSLRRSGLVRSQDRWIGGVAGGLAQKLGVDPLIVRGAFVVLTLFGGLAVVLYGLAWALLPEAADGRIHLQEAIRGRFDAALAGAAAFVVVGLARPVFWFDPDRWVPGWLLGLAWLGLLITVIVVGLTVVSTNRRGGPPYTAPPFAPDLNGAPSMSSSSPAGPTPYPAPQPGGPPPAGQQPTSAQTTYPPTSAHPTTATYPTTGAYQPAAAPPTVAGPAWQAPPPPRPRTPGPGSTTVAVVLALSLFAGAGALLAHRADLFTGSAVLTAAGAVIAVLGLGALVSGLRGRRAGGLAGTAVVLAILAVPAAVVSTAIDDLPRGIFDDGSVIGGDVEWAPSTVAEAESGFSYAIGEARVDLTGPAWPTEDGAEPARVRIEAGAGSTTVIVPTGVPLEVRTHVGAGEIDSLLAGDWTRSLDGATGQGSTATPEPGATPTRVTRTEAQGTNLDLVLRSPAAAGPTGADALALVVTVDAGLGDVTIEEEI